MDAPTALFAGFLAGLAIAMQLGPVSLLVINAALTAGPRAGAAAAMGVATVDLAFAAVAAAAGGTARAALAGHQAELRALAAFSLSAIAVRGLRSALRGRSHGDAGVVYTRPGVRRHGRRSAPAQYLRFLAITAVNPLTIASFASVAAALSLDGIWAGLAFVAGVGAASGAWHLVLALAAGSLGRRITPRMERALAIGGGLAVLGVATRLALAI